MVHLFLHYMGFPDLPLQFTIMWALPACLPSFLLTWFREAAWPRLACQRPILFLIAISSINLGWFLSFYSYRPGNFTVQFAARWLRFGLPNFLRRSRFYLLNCFISVYYSFIPFSNSHRYNRQVAVFPPSVRAYNAFFTNLLLTPKRCCFSILEEWPVT